MAAQKKTVKSIAVTYTGEMKSVFAPGLGAFEKGESRTFTDNVSIDLVERLIKGNKQFKEGDQ